jgi:predicted acetyltransferase
MKVEVRGEVSGLAHRRQVFVDGRPVSRLVVHDRLLWMLGTQIRMGGIGGVETDREHRRKGYSRRLLEDTLDYMAGLGQEVSMLFGIPDFYDKFGYAPFMPEHTIRVATRDAERFAREAPGHTARPACPDDRSFLIDLYSRESRLRPGPLVRSADTWPGFRMGSSYDRAAAAVVLEDADGTPAAYAAFDDQVSEVTAIEANAADPCLFPALLRELAALAVERRCGHIDVLAPPDHPFSRFLTRCGCQMTTTYPRMGGGMMRLIDQDALLAKLETALAARMEQSRFAGTRVTLRIETDLGSSELGLGARGAGRERINARVALPQQTLMQLMVGYRSAADVVSEPNVESAGKALAVLDALFGGQSPYVWRADRF